MNRPRCYATTRLRGRKDAVLFLLRSATPIHTKISNLSFTEKKLRPPRSSLDLSKRPISTHIYPYLPQFRFGCAYRRRYDACFDHPIHYDEHCYALGEIPSRDPSNLDHFVTGTEMQFERYGYTLQALPPANVCKLPNGYLIDADFLDAVDSINACCENDHLFTSHPQPTFLAV